MTLCGGLPLGWQLRVAVRMASACANSSHVGGRILSLRTDPVECRHDNQYRSSRMSPWCQRPLYDRKCHNVSCSELHCQLRPHHSQTGDSLDGAATKSSCPKGVPTNPEPFQTWLKAPCTCGDGLKCVANLDVLGE